MRSNGGFCTAWMMAPRSGLWPLRQAASRIAESRMCSRLLIGRLDAEQGEQSRHRGADAVLEGRGVASVSAPGAAKERSTDSGRPDSDPGV